MKSIGFYFYIFLNNFFFKKSNSNISHLQRAYLRITLWYSLEAKYCGFELIGERFFEPPLHAEGQAAVHGLSL